MLHRPSAPLRAALSAGLLCVAGLACDDGFVRSQGDEPDAGNLDTGDDPEVGGVDDGGELSTGALAHDVAIAEIALFQGVKVSLAKDGWPAPAGLAPPVEGRAGLLRVYVAPGAAFAPRRLAADVRIGPPGAEGHFTVSAEVARASTDAALASTLNVDVPAALLTSDAHLAVALREVDGHEGGGADGGGLPDDHARFPIDGGLSPLGARSAGDGLRVMIVPVRYDADGSGRLPDTSAAQVERYRQTFLGLYPARAVEVTVRAEPMIWSAKIGADGSGWGEVLQAAVRLRQSDRAPKDLYYYAAFEPTAGSAQFCGNGCVAGLCGLLTAPGDASSRACVGIGYPGDVSAGAAAHEIGHAHGRAHAPCGGAARPDPQYPYADASVGSWGWDIVKKQLKSPSQAKDFMAYCRPTWISDYNFGKLFDRMAFVAGAEVRAADEPAAYRFVTVHGDGRLTWGERMLAYDRPLTEPVRVTWDDAQGGRVAEVTGHYYAYGDLPGGYLLVPDDLPLHVARVTIDDPARRFARATLARPRDPPPLP